MEHIPHFLKHSHHDLIFDVVNEIIRISKHNAILEIRVPYPRSTVLCHPSHCRLINQKTFVIFTEKNTKHGSGERNLVNGGRLELIKQKIIRECSGPINDYHFRKYLLIEVGRPSGLALIYKVRKYREEMIP